MNDKSSNDNSLSDKNIVDQIEEELVNKSNKDTFSESRESS